MDTKTTTIIVTVAGLAVFAAMLWRVDSAYRVDQILESTPEQSERWRWLESQADFIQGYQPDVTPFIEFRADNFRSHLRYGLRGRGEQDGVSHNWLDLSADRGEWHVVVFVDFDPHSRLGQPNQATAWLRSNYEVVKRLGARMTVVRMDPTHARYFPGSLLQCANHCFDRLAYAATQPGDDGLSWKPQLEWLAAWTLPYGEQLPYGSQHHSRMMPRSMVIGPDGYVRVPRRHSGRNPSFNLIGAMINDDPELILKHARQDGASVEAVGGLPGLVRMSLATIRRQIDGGSE